MPLVIHGLASALHGFDHFLVGGSVGVAPAAGGSSGKARKLGGTRVASMLLDNVEVFEADDRNKRLALLLDDYGLARVPDAVGQFREPRTCLARGDVSFARNLRTSSRLGRKSFEAFNSDSTTRAFRRKTFGG